jgi:hypothetical protein
MKALILVLLLLGMGCLVMAVWSLLEGEIRSALLGGFLGGGLLWSARRRLPRTRVATDAG